MTRDELTEIIAEQVITLSHKLDEAITLGKPQEAVDYASALSSTAMAYDSIAIRADD